ncbi:hypothetical protein BDV40DRAFT_100280 [Aspergillus tamarii]|uniref:Uncharacterized protein n=1 Tax=Aspergillus tamarii TaxID=41984 RepID=A0A5N6UCI5_ASPTM|nr:hypothetical protein BDV40DRAFT_100280 [Aspergillus tamarii]
MRYTLYYSGSFVLSALSVAILTLLSYTSLVYVNLTEHPDHICSTACSLSMVILISSQASLVLVCLIILYLRVSSPLELATLTSIRCLHSVSWLSFYTWPVST